MQSGSLRSATCATISYPCSRHLPRSSANCRLSKLPTGPHQVLPRPRVVPPPLLGPLIRTTCFSAYEIWHHRTSCGCPNDSSPHHSHPPGPMETGNRLVRSQYWALLKPPITLEPMKSIFTISVYGTPGYPPS